MRDGRIKESQLSCASYMKPEMNKTGSCAHFARPGSVGVFMVEEGLLHYDRRNFLQVDFRSRTRVEMVIKHFKHFYQFGKSYLCLKATVWKHEIPILNEYMIYNFFSNY